MHVRIETTESRLHMDQTSRIATVQSVMIRG